ncbi:MAG: hypothetical protein AABZ06_04120, partial [Bdellovibrionota bacterium]
MSKRVAELRIPHFFGNGSVVKLPVRTELHLARKAWHLVMGSFIAFTYLSGVSSVVSVAILSSILIIDLFMETMRLRSQGFNEKVIRIMGPVMRAHEVHQSSAVPHYLFATIIAIAVFPKPVAVLSIMY